MKGSMDSAYGPNSWAELFDLDLLSTILLGL
jgi:hypothetical protein